MRKDFNHCNALIYDEAGNLLSNSRIDFHDELQNYIIVPNLPELTPGLICDLLILTAPKPYTFKGRVQDRARGKAITLYNEKTTDLRQEPRYKIDLPALIETLIYDEKSYPLSSPLEAKLINISKGGIRFRTCFNAMAVGHRFQIRMKTGESDKLLIADVVCRNDKVFVEQTNYSEFGCQLVGDADE
jgi:hypothetical protein